MSSIGNILRTERETQGRTLTEVSKAVYIKTKYLSALEEENFAVIPGEVYVKGFIRAYASYLGMDGEELVAQYCKLAGDYDYCRSNFVYSPHSMVDCLEVDDEYGIFGNKS